MLCYMLCYVMLCYVMLCYVMLCYVTEEDHTVAKEVILRYFCLHLINVASMARQRPFVMFLL